MSSPTTDLSRIEAEALSLFCRQYLQLVPPPSLILPPAPILSSPTFQSTLYTTTFAPNALPQPPPPRYTYTILKRLITALESATSVSPDLEIDSDLIDSYTTHLLSPPRAIPPTDRLPVVYTLPPPHGELTILESPTLISGMGCTGHRTWEAALALTEWLLLHPEVLENSQKTLDLGAGTGLIALLAGRAGVGEVLGAKVVV